MTDVAQVGRGALVAAFMVVSGHGFAQQAAPPPAATPIEPQKVQTMPLPPPPAEQPAPAASAPATPAPATPVPATPAPAAPESPAAPGEAPPAGAPAAPAVPPAQAAPAETVPPATGAQHPDAIKGEMTVLNPMPVLTRTGTSSWAEGFDNIVLAVDAIMAQMGRLGLRRAGDVMVVYTSSDEAGFEFEAQIPFAGESTERPADDVTIGASFSGRVMKFHHSGSFADMDVTYEGVANFLDARNVESQNFYIERYLTDPATTQPDALEVDIFVPLR